MAVVERERRAGRGGMASISSLASGNNANHNILMRKIFYLLLACLLGLCAASAAEGGRRLKVATTIDFLDYVFDDRGDGHDWYPLERWEERVKEIADCGIRKVYLRVNVCGLTLWPSRVSAQYGQDGRMHYETPELGRRLAKTLAAYDPLRETIRLGHKYGMEVWCWDSLWDDGAYYKSGEEYPELVARFGNFPLADTWHEAHPGCWSRRDPKLDPPPPRPPVDVARHPVARIVLVSDIVSGRPSHFTKETLRLYVSGRNGDYRPYEGEFALATGQDGEGHQTLVVDGLRITEPYVKLWHATFPKSGYGFTFGDGIYNLCHVYDADGAELPVTWGQYIGRKAHDPVADKLSFGKLGRFAWDSGDYQLGFIAGRMPQEGDPAQWLVGVPELAVPAALSHKVDRFRELAAYDFDGFTYNIRSHSNLLADSPDSYGFNPEVRNAFLTRYGIDIYTQEFDRERLHELRSEAIDEFLRRCKELAGKRPLFMTVGRQPVAHNRGADWSYRLGARWHYDQWFKDGSVDGVTMMGDNFAAFFQGKRSNGHPVTVGAFLEMGGRPADYDLKAELEALARDERLDEVELYETISLMRPDRRRSVSDFIKGK